MFCIGQHCCPNWRPTKRGRKIRRDAGSAAGGEGASDGGTDKKQPAAAKRHEGCLQEEWLALGRSPFLPSPAGGDGGKGARTWIASGPRCRSFRGSGGEREYGDECVRFRPV